MDLLQDVFVSIEAMVPSKSASDYWQVVNRAFLNRAGTSEIWREEKVALLESVEVARQEALRFLAEERERVMGLSRQESIQEVLDGRKLDTRIQAVTAVVENGLLDIGAR